MTTITTKNYKVRLAFARNIVKRMGIDEIRRFKKRVWLECSTDNISIWLS